MNWVSNPAIETASPPREDTTTALMRAARQRILIIDGAMGTQIQGLGSRRDAFPRRPFSFAATATCKATTTS